MRRTVTVVSLVVFLPLFLCSCERQGGPEPSAGTRIEVYFSPAGGCTEAIVRELGKARSTVLAQAYSFTSDAIAQALFDAHLRGARVQVILDKSEWTEHYTPALLSRSSPGFSVFIDGQHAIAHNKVIIIDGRTVITGSFNFTKAAESYNAENLLVIHDPALAAKYTANWELHRAHSTPCEMEPRREEKYLEGRHRDGEYREKSQRERQPAESGGR